jgi:hypothetical protein
MRLLLVGGLPGAFFLSQNVKGLSLSKFSPLSFNVLSLSPTLPPSLPLPLPPSSLSLSQSLRYLVFYPSFLSISSLLPFRRTQQMHSRARAHVHSEMVGTAAKLHFVRSADHAHKHMYACAYASTRSVYTYSERTRACTHTRTHEHARAHAHTLHSHTHKYTQSRTHTHTQSQTHRDSLIRAQALTHARADRRGLVRVRLGRLERAGAVDRGGRE